MHPKDEFKSLIWNDYNSYQFFVEPCLNPHWVGILISFSGENATYFYQFIKEKKVNWNSFCDSVNSLQFLSLSRFDIHYFRQTFQTDDDLHQYMTACRDKRLQNTRFTAWNGRKEQGLIAKFGNRSSNNHYRIYDKTQGVEFELEIKNNLIKSFQKDFFSNNFKEFETKIANHYFRQSKKYLCYDNYDSCYNDWLIIWIRKQRPEHNSLGLVTDYKTLNERISSLIMLYYHANQSIDSDFLTLLQFLSFCKYQIQDKTLTEDQKHYRVEFLVQDLMHFMQRKMNYYQLEQTVLFLKKLQDLNLLIEDISSVCYVRVSAFPYLKFSGKGFKIVVEVDIIEDLVFYNYPYWFPASFIIPKNHYDQKVICQIIESFSVVGYQKTFPVQEFFEKAKNSNQIKAKLRKYIIERLRQLVEANIIRSNFWIVYPKGFQKSVTTLTPELFLEIEFLILEEILE
jgi:hypothetical protein